MITSTENNLMIADDFCKFSRTYSYAPSGLTTAKTLGNGITYSATFDSANRLTSLEWENGRHTLAGYNYAYDDAGNKKYEEKVHDPSNSQLYKYDTTYQVDGFKEGKLNKNSTDVLHPDRTQTWNYDPMGNWNRFADSDARTQVRTHNKVNELEQITEIKSNPRPRPVKTDLTYDNNGNLLDDGEFVYSWDSFNRLIEVKLKRNSQIVGQYFYDAMHRRTKRLANIDHNKTLETQVLYVYGRYNCISEYGIRNSQLVIRNSFVSEERGQTPAKD